MSNAPLMPKATAVWLVDNTALTFDQVADFTKMHPLEIRAIADGDAAQGIKGMDPISNGQLTREEIERAEQDGRAAFARAREREWAVAHLGPEEPWAVAPAPVGIESGASPNGSTVGPQAAATTS